MEFKLSYEMWRVGRWAVSIPHVSCKYHRPYGISLRLVICLPRLCKSLSLDGMLMFELEFEQELTVLKADWEDEELIFTVHLEENNSPENLQWDIRKTYTDVIYFRNIWQVKGRWKALFYVFFSAIYTDLPVC